ncbi:efflux RND transporter periplasmic adaptor subunit [Arthrobacter sp. GMC3]|uniref:efflux RND transporter periplasmic adaptor subunit n=1 Tax=Arthrobacter sp. GMC3 TaxID=2058894 RepID=UPI000CE3A603|nr:efflux RND transporter periplasmic adaptor subunit [Arthrobacter sp. GMC3]
MAFIDGIKNDTDSLEPQARIEAPTIAPARATVTNTVELPGTVQNDPAVPLRATAAGKVVHFFVEKGAQLAAGDKIFQVRSEVIADAPASPLLSKNPAATSGEDTSGTSSLQQPAPVYTYTNVVAPAAGTLETFTVLMNQEVSVGDAAGAIAPGTFTITGSLTTAQQFRLLGKPATASGTITNGPAPFDCKDVQLSNVPAAANDTGAGTGVGAAAPGPMGAGPAAATGTGQVSCAVPAGTAVFAGLGATITLTAGEAANVLTLPLTAVKGTVQNGVVWVSGGAGSTTPEERKVVLGLNDGEKVEIASGLAEGELVLEFVPGVDAVVQPGQMGGFSPMGG